jgi:fluoroquinolone transport system ATP-binding protein
MVLGAEWAKAAVSAAKASDFRQERVVKADRVFIRINNVIAASPAEPGVGMAFKRGIASRLVNFSAMIAVKVLSFTYPKSTRPALQGLEFRVGAGEVFGLSGPAGAGKSTLHKVLVGLIREYTGTVEFQGKELRDWSRDFYERIGVSFGFPTHFLRLTAEENLSHFARLYSGATESIPALLEKVGLAGDAGERVARFSEGMKNRLSFARALLHKPQALFLDEPMAGLEPAESLAVSGLIEAQKSAGRAVVLATRDITLAGELCDRLALIVEGRIAIIDRPRELRNRFGPDATPEEIFIGVTRGRPA